MAVRYKTVDFGKASSSTGDQVSSTLRSGGYGYRKHIHGMQLVGVTTYTWYWTMVNIVTHKTVILRDRRVAYDYIYPVERRRVRAMYKPKFIDEVPRIEDDAEYLLGGSKSILGA